MSVITTRHPKIVKHSATFPFAVSQRYISLQRILHEDPSTHRPYQAAQ
jgi:hypothetical protein